jgi:O-acetylhomoserine (thiol)-lyase
MKSDTIAVHGGYETEPTTRAVAVPIYQTVAYEFDSADHGAALFNLEVEGHRYSRISNPTTAVLERRVAELEGGVEALCTSTGQAALNYAILNLADMGTNIVSVPQLYGTTHTLFAHLLPSQGIGVRFAESDAPDAIDKLIDDNTRGIFCETSAIRPATSATLRRWRKSPSGAAFRSSSTTRWRRRSCCGRSTTAPISSSIR